MVRLLERQSIQFNQNPTKYLTDRTYANIQKRIPRLNEEKITEKSKHEVEYLFPCQQMILTFQDSIQFNAHFRGCLDEFFPEQNIDTV